MDVGGLVAPALGERERMHIVNRFAHKRACELFGSVRAKLLEELAIAAKNGADSQLLRAWAREVEPTFRK